MEKLANGIPKAVRYEGFIFGKVEVPVPFLHGIFATVPILLVFDLPEIGSAERVQHVGHNPTELNRGWKCCEILVDRELSGWN